MSNRTPDRTPWVDDRMFKRIGSKIIPQPDGCWAWKGKLATRAGYVVYGGVSEPAYRVVWMLLRGPIPDGAHIHHTCENPGCCNPDHLLPVSPAEHRRIHARTNIW